MVFQSNLVTAQPVAGEPAKKVYVWSVCSTRTPFLRNFQPLQCEGICEGFSLSSYDSEFI